VFQLSTVAFGTSAFSLLNARVLRHSTLFSCILAVLNSPTIFLRKGFSFFQQALDIFWMVHNFVRSHFTTREVPAVALGIIEKGLTWEDLLQIRLIC
jgi:hypothetical protein